MFEFHIKLLDENTAILTEIYRNTDIYLGNYKTENYIHQAIIEKLKK